MLFSLQSISAFLHLGTPDSTLALCLGAILNREITPKMPPNVALNILQTHTHTHTHTHTFTVWILKQGSSIAPCSQTSAGNEFVQRFKFFANLPLTTKALGVDWEITNKFKHVGKFEKREPTDTGYQCIRLSLTKAATSTLLQAFSPLLVASPSYHLAGWFQLPLFSHLIFSSNSPRVHIWYTFLSFCYEKWYIQGNPSRGASNKWLHKISHNSEITAFPVIYRLSFLRFP